MYMHYIITTLYYTCTAFRLIHSNLEWYSPPTGSLIRNRAVTHKDMVKYLSLAFRMLNPSIICTDTEQVPNEYRSLEETGSA